MIESYSNFFNNKQIKQRTKEKRKATNRKIYGCDFSLSNKKVRQKIEKTCLKKYGVENFITFKFFGELTIYQIILMLNV